MKLYFSGRRGQVDAEAEYERESGEMTVLKGSRISAYVAGGKFRSARSVENRRSEDSVKNCMVVKDMRFKSPSAAANFVTGSSTNGLVAWKTKDGKTLKAFLSETEQ